MVKAAGTGNAAGAATEGTPGAGAGTGQGAAAPGQGGQKPPAAGAGAQTDGGTGKEAGAGGEGGEGQAGKKPDAKPTAAPEKYELKLPEGTIVDDELMGEFTALGKELGYSNDQAQKLADLHLKTVSKALALAEHNRTEALAERRKGWTDAIAGHKELGGAKLDASLAVARSVFGQEDDKGNELMPGLAKIPGVNNKAVRAMLRETGAGDHPAMFAIMHWLGSQLGEDGALVRAASQPPANAGKTTAERMYPNNPK